ncbi:Trehalose 6-phosphate phosphorylase [Dirofilaria immitis]
MKAFFRYLEKKNQIVAKSENEAIQREGGSSKANMIVEQQMTNPTESREVNYEMHQDNSDSQRHSALPIIHGKVKQ